MSGICNVVGIYKSKGKVKAQEGEAAWLEKKRQAGTVCVIKGSLQMKFLEKPGILSQPGRSPPHRTLGHPKQTLPEAQQTQGIDS